MVVWEGGEVTRYRSLSRARTAVRRGLDVGCSAVMRRYRRGRIALRATDERLDGCDFAMGRWHP